ncbi:MAG: hypothetical protein ACFB51_08295 [Anaerolineae bacterium]
MSGLVEKARLELAELMLTPVDREEAEDALAVLEEELAKDKPNRDRARAAMQRLRLSAPPVANLMLEFDADDEPAQIDIDAARAQLDELTLAPVNREAAEEALDALAEALTADTPDPDVLAEEHRTLRLIAPSLLKLLRP